MKLKANLYAPILFSVIMILVGMSETLVHLAARLSENSFLTAMLIRLAVYLIPLAFYYRVRNLNPVTTLKFSYVAPNKISFLAILSAIFALGVILLRYAGLFWFDSAMIDTPSVMPLEVESDNIFLFLFGSAILPAFLEEILFRGVLLEEYASYGMAWSVGISALMSAMAHLSFENFFFYLFVGAMFALIASVSRSIVPTLILHILFNLSAYYIHSGVVDYLRQAGKSPLLPYLLIALFLFLFYLMFSRLEQIYQDRVYDEMLRSRKELLRKELEEADEKRAEENLRSAWEKRFSNFKEIYLSPAFLVSCAAFICLALDLFGQ